MVNKLGSSSRTLRNNLQQQGKLRGTGKRDVGKTKAPNADDVGLPPGRRHHDSTGFDDGALQQQRKTLGTSSTSPLTSTTQTAVSRRRKAGAQAALAGVDKVKGGKRDGLMSRIKKGTLAALVGIMALNATVPSLAAAEITPNLQTPTAIEMQADSTTTGGGFNPLTAQLFNASGDTLPDLGSDNVDDAHPATTQSADSTAVQAQTDKAINGFSEKVKDLFQPTAQQMAEAAANGETWGADRTLTADEQKVVTDALKDMLQEMPVAAFSPDLANALASFLEGKGVDVDKLDGGTLKDYGDAGGEFAKLWVDNLKDDKPVVFYSAVAAAAAAGLTYGYLEGSAGLEKLGVDPEFSVKAMKGQMKLDVATAWDKGYENFDLDVAFDNNFKLGDKYKLAQSGNVDHHFGTGELDVNINNTLTKDGDPLKVKLNYSTDGTDHSGSAGYFDQYKLGESFTLSQDLSGSYATADGDYSFSSSSTLQRNNDAFRIGLTADLKPTTQAFGASFADDYKLGSTHKLDVSSSGTFDAADGSFDVSASSTLSKPGDAFKLNLGADVDNDTQNFSASFADDYKLGDFKLDHNTSGSFAAHDGNYDVSSSSTLTKPKDDGFRAQLGFTADNDAQRISAALQDDFKLGGWTFTPSLSGASDFDTDTTWRVGSTLEHSAGFNVQSALDHNGDLSINVADNVKLERGLQMEYEGAATYNITDDKLKDLSVGVGLTHDNGNLQLSYNQTPGVDDGHSLSVSGRYQQGTFNVEGGGEYFLDSGEGRGRLSMGYNPHSNLDVHVFGEVDSRNDDVRAGVGLRWRF